MNKSPDLSIVIGSYNNKDLSVNLINSIYKYTKNIDYEIIFIDDKSPDDAYEYIKTHFKSIRVYRNKYNLKYSKTYNRGTRLAKGQYIVHLNADSLFTNKTELSELIKYMDNNPKAGILGNKVLDYYSQKLDPDNRHQVPTLANAVGQSLGLYKFFPNVKLINYYMTYLEDEEIAEIGGVGGFMLFRRQLIKEVGFLDEGFKIYCQDTDFCYRTLKAGWKIIYYPKSTIIHFGGGSVRRFNFKNQIIFHEDLWRYYNKNLASKYSILIKFLVFFGLFFRFFTFLIVELILEVKKIRK